MKKGIRTVVSVLCCLCFLGQGVHADPAPIPVILDTDLATDCDDAAALAMLHGWATTGHVNFLAVGVSTKNQYNVLCVDAINTWYGRGTLPIGVTKNAGAYTPNATNVKYARQISQEYPRTNTSWTHSNDAPDVISVYRQTLAAQPDIDADNPGVVIISIGMLTNISDLLQSGPCTYSSLNGTQLVQAKVRFWSCMGGRFFDSNTEYNIRQNISASQYAIHNWPTPLVLSPWEVGDPIRTGSGLQPLTGHILRRIYHLSGYLTSGRQSWDQCASFYAVLGIDNGPAANYWTLSGPGNITVQSNGRTTWQSHPQGLQRYKTIPPNRSTSLIAAEIEGLMIDAEPFVGVYPVSQTVSAGSTVEFSVSVPVAQSYQWYKDGEPLSGSSGYSGQTTPNLTVFNAQVADEGYYYCVMNGNTNVPDWQKAQLLTRRLVGWWKLDGNANDSIQTIYPDAVAHHGTSPNPTRTHEDGIDGSGLVFSGATGDVVTLNGSAAFYNFYSRGYTVSTWVNAPPAADRAGIVGKSKYYGDAPNRRGFGLNHNSSGQAVHTLRESWGNLNSGTVVTDNTWHLITGTYDPASGTGCIYINGTLVEQTVNGNIPLLTDNELRFGIEGTATPVPFEGMLDDVRLWSYPLNSREVAFLHNSFDICEGMPEYDLSGPYGVPDCIVDFYDFAKLAADWMEGYSVSDLALLAEEWLDCNLLDCVQ